ncbi:MAG: DUF4403 family protein [Labilithrix sp.]|nr:DUF4403 family protein [Labilithrix sp.]
MIRNRTPSSPRVRSLAALISLACACGGRDAASPGRAEPLPETCRVNLGPRSEALPGATPAPAPPASSRSSRLVAHVELKLATLTKELESKIGPRLAEERNKGIGIAGHLNYTVDRGPFSVAIEGDSLVVRTDVKARAEACRGRSCYASCEPQGRATATVPLRLTPEYRFAPSRVAFAFTRGCEVRALGGMVKIDVTPTIQSAIQPSLRRVEQEIDGELPPLRPQAERLWAEIGKSRSLPLGGCVVTNPRGIVQGPAAGRPESLRVRFGLVAYPELRSRCGDVPAARPLPPLTHDPALPAEDDLVLALVSPLATSASGLEGSDPFDAGGARSRIARATAVPAGSLAQLDLGLRGEACGDLAVRSTLGWTEDGRSLRLVAPVFAKGERERVAGTTLAPDTIVRSLTAARFAPPVPPETLKELVPTIASSMSDPTLDVRAKVGRVQPLDVVLRGEDLAASVLVRGSVELKQR